MVNIKVSNKKNNELPESISFYLVDSYQIDGFVGKTLGNIEALGLADKQEEAFKKLVKREIWALFTEGEYNFIDADIARLVRSFKPKMTAEFQEYYRKQEAEGKIPGSLKGEYMLSFEEKN